MRSAPNYRQLRAVVSGSFHRHMDAIMTCVQDFRDTGVEILSPSDPRVVDADGPFLFVASDRHRSVRLVQDRHLAAVDDADFLWLVCPDGYIGQSASLEIGFAIARGVPIYSTTLPPDLTLRQYITKVPGITAAIARERSFGERVNSSTPTLLVSPHETADELHRHLDVVEDALTTQQLEPSRLETVVADRLGEVRRAISVGPIKRS